MLKALPHYFLRPNRYWLGHLFLAIIATLFISVNAHATLISATPNADFSGTISATGFPTITFDDFGGTGTVTVEIDLTNLAPSTAFTSDWWFNFDGNATSLGFGNISKTGTFDTPTFNTCNNCTNLSSFRPDGDGFFDIWLSFVTSGSARFDAGEILKFDITLAGITANDFNLLSIAGTGDTSNDFHCVATHVQGTTGDGSDHLGASSCSSNVPEPTTLALMSLGLIGLGFNRRRVQG